MKRFSNVPFIITVLLLFVILVGACGSPAPDNRSSQQKEQANLEQGQQELIAKQPAPVLDYSLERENIKKRLLRFNDPNKISYFYELSDNGQVIAFFPIKGKISSVSSYMTTSEQVINDPYCHQIGDGSSCNGIVMEAPDSDGSYGTNGEAVFGFTTDDTYFEWNGKYELFDRPMKLSSAPVLVYTEAVTDTQK